MRKLAGLTRVQWWTNDQTFFNEVIYRIIHIGLTLYVYRYKLMCIYIRIGYIHRYIHRYAYACLCTYVCIYVCMYIERS